MGCLKGVKCSQSAAAEGVKPNHRRSGATSSRYPPDLQDAAVQTDRQQAEALPARWATA